MEQGDMIIAMVLFFLIVSVGSAQLVSSLRITVVHPSAVHIIVGFLFGGAARLAFTSTDWSAVTFDRKLFFKVVLPVIVFASGYSLDLRVFFGGVRTTILLTVVGTLLNWAALAITTVALNDAGVGPPITHVEALLLASCLASADTVAAAGNPPVAIALFGAVKDVARHPRTRDDASVGAELLGRVTLNFLLACAGSVGVGAGVGLASAFCARRQRSRPPVEVEVTQTLLFGLFGYFLAEGLGFSGFLALFLCGMVMSHYTVWSTSKAARYASFHALATLSYAGTALIFSSLGFFVWAYFTREQFWGQVSGAKQDFALAGALLGAIVAYRAASVVLLVAVANAGRPAAERPTLRSQAATVWGGLVRGAVAFALSQDIDTANRDVIVTVVYIIVLVTTVVVGCLTRPVMALLAPERPPAPPPAAPAPDRRRASVSAGRLLARRPPPPAPGAAAAPRAPPPRGADAAGPARGPAAPLGAEAGGSGGSDGEAVPAAARRAAADDSGDDDGRGSADEGFLLVPSPPLSFVGSPRGSAEGWPRPTQRSLLLAPSPSPSFVGSPRNSAVAWPRPAPRGAGRLAALWARVDARVMRPLFGAPAAGAGGGDDDEAELLDPFRRPPEG